MKYSVCAYFDTELEKFYPPFLMPQSFDDISEGVVEAAKKGKIEDVGSKKVFALGSFDTASGEFDLLSKPEMLVDLTSYKEA